MTEIVAIPQTEPVAVETGEGIFLVAPDGTVLERLRVSRSAWVLQRNDFPFAVYLDQVEATAECLRHREEDRKWREENAHVADVRVFWNVYQATLEGDECP
jgi:hypothetical protein